MDENVWISCISHEISAFCNLEFSSRKKIYAKAKIHLLGFFAPWEINPLYIICKLSLLVFGIMLPIYVLSSVYYMQVISLLNTNNYHSLR